MSQFILELDQETCQCRPLREHAANDAREGLLGVFSLPHQQLVSIDLNRDGLGCHAHGIKLAANRSLVTAGDIEERNRCAGIDGARQFALPVLSLGHLDFDAFQFQDLRT